eukprot:5452400-Pyramimonas_sp.AAC.1
MPLPRDEWPTAWKNTRNLVCPLILSLYGHPDAGGYWEQHCEGHVLSQDFIKCNPWRSCYFHPKLRLYRIVYVEDFKLPGPQAKLDKGFERTTGATRGMPQ